MAYITLVDYEAYTSTAIDADEFPELAELASVVIDAVTFQRVQVLGFAALTEAAQAAVINAVCAEVKYLYANGGVNLVAGMSGGVQSASIGKFSYSGGAPVLSVNGIPVSPLITSYLINTGLMYRGIRYDGAAYTA